MAKNSKSYTLEDEAALLAWAGRVAGVDRRKLGAWVLSALSAEPNSRAEHQARYGLAEVFLAAFKRKAAKTPTDAVLLGLIAKLERIMAEGNGQQVDTSVVTSDNIEL